MIANGVGLVAYRIDLAFAVCKYMGETEKNLDMIFDAASGIPSSAASAEEVMVH